MVTIFFGLRTGDSHEISCYLEIITKVVCLGKDRKKS